MVNFVEIFYRLSLRCITKYLNYFIPMNTILGYIQIPRLRFTKRFYNVWLFLFKRENGRALVNMNMSFNCVLCSVLNLNLIVVLGHIPKWRGWDKWQEKIFDGVWVPSSFGVNSQALKTLLWQLFFIFQNF